MSTWTRQDVPLSSGVTLEVELYRPTTPSANGHKLALCLHPWGWLGGSMKDPVLGLVVKHLQDMSFHILRYNSRGFGRSTGWPSMTGFSEAQDLEVLVQWALTTEVKDVESLVLIGYSYGALITSLHPVLPPPIKTSHLLLSYPLGPRGLLTCFRTQTYAAKLRETLQQSTANILVLYGDRDEFTGVTNYNAWTEELVRDAKPDAALKVEKIVGGSHFWMGNAADEMGRLIREWLP